MNQNLCHILSIPIEIIYVIINNRDILRAQDIIFFVSSNRFFLENIKIPIFRLSESGITDKILNQDKYQNIEYLNFRNNNCLRATAYLPYLTKLNISATYPFDQASLNFLSPLSNLLFLDMSYNDYITSISHLTSLTVLKCRSYNRLGKLNNIKSLTNLISLDISQNQNITNISDLTKLSKLHIDSTKIEQNDINYLTNLTILSASYTSINNINHLINLTKLDISYNKNIIDISTLTKLTELNSECTIINQNNINSLTNLVTLNIRHNKYIYDISHLSKLTFLNSGYTIIGQNSINNMHNLISLCMCCNENITNIAHLTNLQYLDISGSKCKINQANIMNLLSLKNIEARYNNNITSTSHLTNLENNWH